MQDFSEILVVARAVPSAVPKLVLALPHAQPGPFSHLSDDLRLSLAQLGLFPSQAFRFPANGVGVHHQRTAHRPGKVEMGRQRRGLGKSIRVITGESQSFFCLLSNTCSVHHNVNSVAEVISSHKPEAFLCCWPPCQPYPPLLSCDDNVFSEQARGRGQSAHFPRGILTLTSDSQACICLLDATQENCVVLHKAGI